MAKIFPATRNTVVIFLASNKIEIFLNKNRSIVDAIDFKRKIKNNLPSTGEHSSHVSIVIGAENITFIANNEVQCSHARRI